jgi:pSer/pThr/pTyr-binding forkhead associated (FHA) protein
VVHLSILSGAQAGSLSVARHFPFEIGRGSTADLLLDAEGVWERHAGLEFRPREGFFLEARPGALVSVNGERVEQARLRNGDLIECGSVKLRFWLAPAVQHSLGLREALTWLALGCLTLFQVALLWRLAA